MKTNLFCLFLLLNTINFCRAQDSSVVLDTSMFDKYFQTIPLTQLKGWIFKQGNDTNCSKTEIDATGWIKWNPSQLTAKNADKNGRLEGWLRMRFTLDSSFENRRIGITTKPTGQGTGLGLSLAYDIIKAHGGEIKVENKKGEGAEFVIVLPTIITPL